MRNNDYYRVSSRIGSGQFSNKFDQAINPVITAGNQNYVRRMALLNNESSKELVKKYNLPPGPATNKGIYEKFFMEGKLDATENPNYVAPGRQHTTFREDGRSIRYSLTAVMFPDLRSSLRS